MLVFSYVYRYICFIFLLATYVYQGETDMRIFLAICMCFAVVSIANAQPAGKLQALSAWTNQSGSTLYIDSVGSNGQVTGTYINRAVGFQCQNISYPVTGWIFGSAITFTTIWQSTTESCNSITAWTGFANNGQLQTLWQLIINGSTSTTQIHTGADTFSPTSSMSHGSLVK